jgi:hypothetical protein
MTEQPTPTIRIKQELDRKLAEIRSNQDLSEAAKRRYIAEAYNKAEAAYREVIDSQEREIADRVEKSEKDVFALSYPYTATEEEKAQIRAAHRAAYNDVYRAVASSKGPQETDTELERLLERAERTQDPELATAVYHVATERGARSVADSYLEKRPKEKKKWESYVEARQEAESVERAIGHALSYGLVRPPELDTPAPPEPAADMGGAMLGHLQGGQ